MVSMQSLSKRRLHTLRGAVVSVPFYTKIQRCIRVRGSCTCWTRREYHSGFCSTYSAPRCISHGPSWGRILPLQMSSTILSHCCRCCLFPSSWFAVGRCVFVWRLQVCYCICDRGVVFLTALKRLCLQRRGGLIQTVLSERLARSRGERSS